MNAHLLRLFGPLDEVQDWHQVIYDGAYECVIGGRLSIMEPCTHKPCAYPLKSLLDILPTVKTATYNNEGKVVIDGQVTGEYEDPLDDHERVSMPAFPDFEPGAITIRVDLQDRSLGKLRKLTLERKGGFPYRQGIWIDGRDMMGMDGQVLGVFKNVCDKGPDAPLLIPNDAIDAISLAKWRTFNIVVGKSSSMAFDGDDGVVIVWNNIETTMPDYKRIIPRLEACKGTVKVGAKYLDRAKALKADVIRFNGNVEYQVLPAATAKIKAVKTVGSDAGETMNGAFPAIRFEARPLRKLIDMLGRSRFEKTSGAIVSLTSCVLFENYHHDLGLILPVKEAWA